MDVRLSPEQQDLRDGAARVVDRLGPKAVGQIDDLARRAKLDAAVDESGWRELRVGTPEGPSLASAVEPAIVAEELGRGLADVAFLGPTLAAELRRLVGAPPSDTLETVLFQADLRTLVQAADVEAADRHGSSVAIDGQGSARALFLAPSGEGYGLCQVDLIAAPSGVDLTRPSVMLNAPYAVAAVAGLRRMTADDLDRWTALGLALTCADLVGTMRGAVQLASDYAKERRQYGAAIGSFQAVQHMLADAFAVTEGARSIALHAAWAVDALCAPEALAAAAAAKAYCARSARDVCEVAIQVHGGLGNTWDCLAHVYLRRALLSSDICGDARVNLARLLHHEGIGVGDGLR
jgi:alkylation response protein AidB-like acyl-CoA dehydrogenase